MVEPRQAHAGWRIGIGFALFGLSLGWPVLLPLLPFLGISGKGIAAVTGVMVVAAEIMLVAAAAVAGKDGFATIKGTVLLFLRSHGPPRIVSRTRYRVGLVLFVAPILLGWVSPYLGDQFPVLRDNPKVIAITGDVVLLVGLFVLGGEFWEKLRSLFVHEADVVMRPVAPSPGPRR